MTVFGYTPMEPDDITAVDLRDEAKGAISAYRVTIYREDGQNKAKGESLEELDTDRPGCTARRI
jgi:hypothetical protein